ncbi:MAG: BstXI family restriction endonuclease [Candidatus Contendobacter sp.]|nr:BstXI family restriction endonuclease [Candidatus Contendobacter sp.]MDG4558224.1 BstXI family restriction endonuclease [Candidatus Contendobacter sp.]
MGKKLPRLPSLLERKLYKTGQTRGADDDVIYQNRVSRNSTVLIPYAFWDRASHPPEGESAFENGFIALISPDMYFGNQKTNQELADRGLELGQNALVFYETRDQWNAYSPDTHHWKGAQSRSAPFGGEYVARIPGTTAMNRGEKIIRGFNSTSIKGAGIRVFEYASIQTIENCRKQLEALFWLCKDSGHVAIKNGMIESDVIQRKAEKLKQCQENHLLDYEKLQQSRILNRKRTTICPLCLEEISSEGFFNRLQQADGREVPDLTVTQLNLFHIDDLQIGVFNHRPYNLGWGHHHCNVVVRDAGIESTLDWMDDVLDKNIDEGYFTPKKRPS